MKIAIMGRWNATCGISQHVETLAYNFLRMGYQVVVYAPTLESAMRDWHHKLIKEYDEPWVKRVYTETEEYLYPYGGIIKSEELLGDNYDILIVETYPRFPLQALVELSQKLRRKTPLIAVVHQSYIREIVPMVKMRWDAIVVFDKRYVTELFHIFGDRILRKIHIIPYPFLTPKTDSFNPVYPEEKKDYDYLFFSFGRQPLKEYSDYFFSLNELKSRYKLKYWVIRSNGPLPLKEKWIIEWRKRPSLEEIYSYLLASDIHLLPKGDTRGVVVSSTLAQTLYAGTPTIVPDTRFFETIEVDERGIGPVVKYRPGDVIDLSRKIKMLLDEPETREKVSKLAREYALKYSETRIVKKFIDLINDIS